MNIQFLPAKLLVVFADCGCGMAVVDASKEGGARGGTRLHGRCLAEDGCSCGSCPDCVDQDIILILTQDETENVITAIVEGTLKNPRCRAGAAIVLDVPKTLLRANQTASHEPLLHTIEGKDMKSGYTMICSIINYGQAEELMAVARQAGARGGTILGARGTGTEEDVKFFGISLTPEKEFLVIISENAATDGILEALSSQPVFSEPGGGIVFTTSIERYISLNA
ncbi:P-II family nitrogen regulator [Desulfovibrio intestinalis]|uniref:Nitrogen regulatory protein PII n=1 Tax=Desulfovibrio intestinalis TaxID=58621 RepID=A0A7W8C2T5_9BACT|nr:P-II family nitrogen regulator [Desulfovibrio intestinalis]MBB5142680.1 nitrogen regulatory protein PII [Desulfovibrio intestinalis]